MQDDVEANAETVMALRETANAVAGANCAYADDDLAVLAHLATRAVRAGLTDDLHITVRKSMRRAYGPQL